MAIKTGAIKAGGFEVYPHTALDQIRKSATSSTTLIASGGVIKKDYLDLTGLISAAYVSSANIIPASAINGLSTAVNNAASTYVNSSGVIPISAVVDLPFISSSYALFEENGWTRWVSAGAGVTVTENSYNFPERDVTIALRDYDTIETLSGNTVVISPGKYYRLDATTGSKTISINSFDTTQWGRESYMEIFVANTGYVVTNAKVVLTAPLEPNSVNNCVIKFRNGFAIISVEDHIGGYIVISSGSDSITSGTLAYGVKSSTSAYIAFNGALDSATAISFGGVTANGVKRIVGNGYDATTLTGSVNCGTSGCTVRNLSLQNVGIAGGVMTLGDAFIPSGSTVAVSGGELAVEKVTGAGSESVIDLGYNSATQTGGTHVFVSSKTTTTVNVSSCTMTNGYVSDLYGGAIFVSRGNAATCNGVLFRNCHGIRGGAVAVYRSADIHLSSCTFDGNTATQTNSNALYIEGANVTVIDCDFRESQNARAATSGNMRFVGSNTFKAAAVGAGSVFIASGATLDLTDNVNATPINMSGGVIIDGGCQVITSAGATVSIAGGTYTQIKKDGTTVPPQA